MSDLTDPRWLYAKGALFVLLGALATAVLWLECPSWRVLGLHALAVWAFARAYYFAFYVVGRYVDPSYRFAGLIDFARYLARRRAEPPKSG